MGTQRYGGARFADLTTLGYSTYTVDPVGVATISFQFAVDYDLTDGATGWQGRLVYEPRYDPANTISTNIWQTWDMLNATARWWSTGDPIVSNSAQPRSCGIGTPCDIATLLTLYPNMGIQTGLLEGILFKAGSGYASFEGYVDHFVIASSSGINDVFNFDPDVITLPDGVSTLPLTPVYSPPPATCDIMDPENFMAGGIPDGTYCRIMMKNGRNMANDGSVPQELIDNGVILALEIYRLQGGRSIATFDAYAQFCIFGEGRLIYRDATGVPRQSVEMLTTIVDGYSCTWIPNPGTLVLIDL